MKGKEMRYVIDCNPSKRGCDLCADVVIKHDTATGNGRKFCIHDECPYHELDDVKRYIEYDKRVKKSSNHNLETWLKKIFILSEKYIDCQKST